MFESESQTQVAEQTVIKRSLAGVLASREVPDLIRRLRGAQRFELSSVWIPDDDGLASTALRAAHPEVRLCASFEEFAVESGRAEVVVLSRQPGLIDRSTAVAIIRASIHSASAPSGRRLLVWSIATLGERRDASDPAQPDTATEDWLISIVDHEAPGRRIKRLIDLVVASLLLVFVAPLMALVALAVRLELPGSALFVQERVGHRGRSFQVVKFRTMCQNAEALDGPVPTMTKINDNRITRLGHFLRKSRIDELPQLINVLQGDMSMVGPRPFRRYLAGETAKRVPFYRVRYAELPGLTGWAQVAYKYPTSMEEQVRKFEFEFEYIARRSTAFDLYIMARTLWVMLCLKGT